MRRCYHCGSELKTVGQPPPPSEREKELEEALQAILRLEGAYPLSVFPEPDRKKARELLEAGGMTLDAISADCMRFALTVVCRIAREALEQK